MVRIDFNRLRFLVIDDNAHMRRILRTLLHGFGAREVYEAEDGAAGLEAFTHYVPDIVITDWAMPIFDGLELKQMIRQPGANSNLYALAELSTEFSSWMEAECERLDKARHTVIRNRFTKANKEALFHAAHDIKGEAATFGYPAVASAADSLCRLIEHTPDSNRIP